MVIPFDGAVRIVECLLTQATLKFKKIVSCVQGREKIGQSGGRDFFFFPNFIFYRLEYTGGKSKKINIFFPKKKKKFQSALFSPPGRWTGNHFLFKAGLGGGFRAGPGSWGSGFKGLETLYSQIR